MAGLRGIAAEHPDLVRDVRGKGLMIGVQFDSSDTAEAVQWAAFQRGLLVLEAGDDVVRMSPPLIVNGRRGRHRSRAVRRRDRRGRERPGGRSSQRGQVDRGADRRRLTFGP